MLKLMDTIAPAADFEIAQAKDISVVIGGNTKMLQEAIDNGDIGGAGDIVVKCTEEQYGALLPAQKALNIIYCTEKFLYYHDDTLAPVVDADAIMDAIGDLEELKTEEKSNLVGAVNEISDSLVDLDTKVDGKADKDSIVAETKSFTLNAKYRTNTQWTCNVAKSGYKVIGVTFEHGYSAQILTCIETWSNDVLKGYASRVEEGSDINITAYAHIIYQKI
ncbi:MAG: hypothetical protein KBT35_07905 [Firmicutes bacterium]|nr:hypothetical protein [Candidatus Colivicinus equi]